MSYLREGRSINWPLCNPFGIVYFGRDGSPPRIFQSKVGLVLWDALWARLGGGGGLGVQLLLVRVGGVSGSFFL